MNNKHDPEIQRLLLNAESFEFKITNDVLYFLKENFPPNDFSFGNKEDGFNWNENEHLSIYSYNTLIALPKEQRENTFQALESFPWLAWELLGFTDRIESKKSTMSIEIIDAIDKKQPLLSKIARHYNVQPSTVKAANRILKENYFHVKSIPVFLSFIDGMKADHRPRTEWERACLVKILWAISEWELEDDVSFIKKMASELYKDGISGALKLFERWCPLHDPYEPFQQLEDYFDHVLGIVNDEQPYLEPSGEFSKNEQARFKSYGELFKDMVYKHGFKKVFIDSEEWHENFLRIESNHPPAEPGAFEGEPLKAAEGVADATHTL